MKNLTVLALLFMANISLADIQYDIKDPQIAAKMDNLVLSADIVEMFWQSYNHPSRPISPPQAMQRIIDDALLAQYARESLTEEELTNSNKVGFANDVKLEDRTTALIRKAYKKALIKQIEKFPQGLASFSKYNSDLTSEELAKIMTLKSSLMIEANDQQKQQAKETIVANIDFSKAGFDVPPLKLTLWDIYHRQNVQGRLAIHKADIQHLKIQIKQRVESLFVLNWAKTQLSSEDFSAIRSIILNEQHKARLLESMGLYADVHDDNPALRERAKSISNDKIKKFYNDNQDEFSVVERVRARHIRVDNQKLADSVVAEIKAGLSFGDAIKKYSIAGDKNDPIPGSLGWLKRSDKKRGWLHAVAFIQQQGKVSAAFRSPINQGDIVYEIILADERIDGVLPYSDPTVRYEASRDIALKELKEEFVALQSKLRKDANIHLNKAALK
jgi:parvulin-like peptidyl-prolyl isomerase